MPFQVGNQLSRGRGRPKSSKNLLPMIRERVLKTLHKRITIDRMLEKIDDVELLKFGMSLMPKDIALNVSTTPINYISNTPRPIDCIVETSPRLIEGQVVNDDTNALKNNNAINNVTDDTIISNDMISIDTDKADKSMDPVPPRPSISKESGVTEEEVVSE